MKHFLNLYKVQVKDVWQIGYQFIRFSPLTLAKALISILQMLQLVHKNLLFQQIFEPSLCTRKCKNNSMHNIDIRRYCLCDPG